MNNNINQKSYKMDTTQLPIHIAVIVWLIFGGRKPGYVIETSKRTIIETNYTKIEIMNGQYRYKQ